MGKLAVFYGRVHTSVSVMALGSDCVSIPVELYIPGKINHTRGLRAWRSQRTRWISLRHSWSPVKDSRYKIREKIWKGKEGKRSLVFVLSFPPFPLILFPLNHRF